MAKRKHYENGISLFVYSTGKEFYVRLIASETEKFPHGIALNPTFEKEEDANAYLDLVAEYMGLINAN
jgi:hypothetical protein